MKFALRAALLLCVLPVSCFAADGVNVEWLAQYGGTCSAADGYDGYLITNEGPVLRILDYTNPASITERARLLMPDVVKRIRVFSHYALVACGLPYGYEERSLFYIVDLANIDQPEIVSSYTGSGYIGDWYLNGDRLYLLLYEYTIEVVDLSDPLAPIQLNRFSQPMGDRARSIAGDGDLVYIGTLDNRLGVVSILAPANVIGQIATDQPVRQILLRGKTCYTIGLGLFCVWNFTDPAKPAFVNSLTFDALHDSITRAGDYIYSVGVSFDVIDVHSAANPDAVAQRALNHFSGHAVANDSGWVFTVGFGLGVTLLDATNPVAPEERAFVPSNIDANRIRVIDGYAVVGTSRQGAVMLDVRKPSKPAYVGPFAGNDFITDIAVHGDRVYVAQPDRIYAVRCANMPYPTLLGTYSAMAYILRASGNRLYFSGALRYDKPMGLGVLDVTGNTPRLLGMAELWESSWYRTFEVNRALVLTSTYWKTVPKPTAFEKDVLDQYAFYDFSTPSAPQLLANVLPDYTTSSTVLSGHSAYLPDGNGVRILDVSDPADPQPTGNWPAYPGGVSIHGNTLLTQTWDSPLELVDISNPAEPRTYASYNDVHGTTEMDNNILYIAEYDGGVKILRVTAKIPAPAAPTRVDASDGDSETTITVQWDEMAGADSYDIWRSRVDSGDAPILLASTSNYTVTDAHPLPGTLYRYDVITVVDGKTSVSRSDTGFAGDLPAPKLVVLPAKQIVNYKSGEIEFEVRNAGAGELNWTAALSNTDWAQIVSGESATNGGTIRIAFDANETGVKRSVTVHIEAPGALGSPFDAKLVQDCRPIIHLPGFEDLKPHFAMFTLGYVSNDGGGDSMPWTASVTSGDWLTLRTESGDIMSELIMDLAYNPSAEPRSALVTVTADDASNSPYTFTITQAGKGAVQLISPNGGEQWQVGKAYPIKWTLPYENGWGVRLQLLHNGKIVHVIDNDCYNDGKRIWRIPSTIKPRPGYRLRIISGDDKTIRDISDAPFEIIPAR